MSNQALDSNEMLTIRWANDDPNPRVTELEEKDERRMLLGALEKKKKMREKEEKRKNLKMKREKTLASMMKNFKRNDQ
jgi:hypothetical protein